VAGLESANGPAGVGNDHPAMAYDQVGLIRRKTR
jgi:hypothetical protein